MENLWQDVRYGARLLRRSPGFSLVAVATLALGIGANSAIFSFVNAILLRPLPYPESERLVFLSEWSEQVPNMSFSLANFQDVRDRNRVFEAVVAQRGQDYVLTGEGEPERLRGRQITAGFFDTLKVAPILGRGFGEEEDRPGAEAVALLGEGLWTRRFGRDPAVLGRRVVLDDEPYTVIGVLPGSLHNTFRQAEIWTSLGRLEERLGGPEHRGSHPGIYVLGRMRPGVSVESARADVVGIAERLAEQYPESNARQSMTLRPALDAVIGPLRPALLVLLGAVGFVLLIACANVANLLIARAATRGREVALRCALGAGRGRVVAQLLSESMMLSLAGGAAGVGLAFAGIRALKAILPTDLPRIEEVGLDARVLAFTFAVAVVTGLVFGLLPALQATRPDGAETLREGGRGSSGSPARQRARALLIVAEVSLALVLLVGAGLMLKSFSRLLDADPGFRPEGALTITVNLPRARYAEEEPRRAFFERMLERIESVPGIEAYGTTAPLLGGWQTTFSIEGRAEAPAGQRPSTDITRISPGLIPAMGMRLLQGRDFTPRDRDGQPLVCIVDETMARSWWPDEDPIGKRLRLGHDDDAPWRTVVGVVAHVKNYGVDDDSRVETWVPYLQDPLGFAALVLRTRGEPAAMTAAVRRAVQAVDPGVPVFDVRTLEEVATESYLPKRLAAQLLAAFAGLALLLAGIGLYGVVAFAVTQRTLEIGIRVALGAERRDILRMVMAQGMRLTGLGLAIGLLAAFALSPALGALLFDVSGTDPVTYGVVPLTLLAVTLLACWVPARRALAVDPMRALRCE